MLDNRFWSKYFQVYDVLNLVEPYTELITKICDELEIKNGDAILDAGCGTGNVAIQIARRGGVVTGVDNCAPALKKYIEKDPHAHTLELDLSKPLPFADQSFDKIASNNVFYTLSRESQEILLKDFHRILKNGGRIVIANPKKGWSPFKIYQATVAHKLKKEGYLSTLILLGRLLWPTIKMFYYNYIIRKESNYHFPDQAEQENMLAYDELFSHISSQPTYADQAILTTGIKSTE